MTNVGKKTKSDIVQSHIKSSYDFINEHLPITYTALVKEKMAELGYKVAAAGSIRNVRTKGLDNKIYQNLDVITALVKVAEDAKAKVDSFINSTETNV